MADILSGTKRVNMYVGKQIQHIVLCIKDE